MRYITLPIKTTTGLDVMFDKKNNIICYYDQTRDLVVEIEKLIVEIDESYLPPLSLI